MVPAQQNLVQVRLGLVQHLNAHPLTFGFRQQKELQLFDDTPARLFEMLSSGELDAALISSVECLRNPNFGYCKTVGVCCNGALRSILYFKSKEQDWTIPAQKIYTDNGSRSSVALLQVLFANKFGRLPSVLPENPEKIADRVVSEGTAGGLLIGDAALRFSMREDLDQFRVKDLGEWWLQQESLPFVFALWAYPKSAPLEDSYFEESLATGLKNLDGIAARSDFPFALEYISQLLHYRLGPGEWAALERFQDHLRAWDLL